MEGMGESGLQGHLPKSRTCGLPPHLRWGRAPGCKSGTSPSAPRSTCHRWQGPGCCTASGPAGRPRRRYESRDRRAPTWPRSHPPAKKNLLQPLRTPVHFQALGLYKSLLVQPPGFHPTPSRVQSTICHEKKMIS